jgi:hypothetical protein
MISMFNIKKIINIFAGVFFCVSSFQNYTYALEKSNNVIAIKSLFQMGDSSLDAKTIKIKLRDIYKIEIYDERIIEIFSEENNTISDKFYFIPTEMFLMILNFLEVETLLKCALVSRKFKPLSEDNQIWKKHCYKWCDQHGMDYRCVEELAQDEFYGGSWKKVYRILKIEDNDVPVTKEKYEEYKKLLNINTNDENLVVEKIFECNILYLEAIKILKYIFSNDTNNSIDYFKIKKKLEYLEKHLMNYSNTSIKHFYVIHALKNILAINKIGKFEKIFKNADNDLKITIIRILGMIIGDKTNDELTFQEGMNALKLVSDMTDENMKVKVFECFEYRIDYLKYTYIIKNIKFEYFFICAINILKSLFTTAPLLLKIRILNMLNEIKDIRRDIDSIQLQANAAVREIVVNNIDAFKKIFIINDDKIRITLIKILMKITSSIGQEQCVDILDRIIFDLENLKQIFKEAGSQLRAQILNALCLRISIEKKHINRNFLIMRLRSMINICVLDDFGKNFKFLDPSLHQAVSNSLITIISFLESENYYCLDAMQKLEEIANIDDLDESVKKEIISSLQIIIKESKFKNIICRLEKLLSKLQTRIPQISAINDKCFLTLHLVSFKERLNLIKEIWNDIKKLAFEENTDPVEYMKKKIPSLLNIMEKMEIDIGLIAESIDIQIEIFSYYEKEKPSLLPGILIVYDIKGEQIRKILLESIGYILPVSDINKIYKVILKLYKEILNCKINMNIFKYLIDLMLKVVPEKYHQESLMVFEGKTRNIIASV